MMMMMMNGKEVGMRMKKGMGVAVVIAVVMAVVLIAFSYTASAESFNRTYTEDGGVLWYEGELGRRPWDAGNISRFYLGEEIRFWSKTLNESVAVTVSGPYESDGDREDDYADYAVPANESWDTEGKTKGYFKVVDAYEHGGWFNARTHSIAVELVGEKEKVREGERFSLRLKKNDRGRGVMKLTIEDDDDFSIINAQGTDIYKIPVGYEERDFVGSPDTPEPADGISIEDGKLVFDTSMLDMKGGEYVIILEDSATGAEDDVDIEVEELYLAVECDDEVVKGGNIVIIIRSSCYEKEVKVTVSDFYRTSLILDEEGKKKAKVSTKDAAFGTHKVTVTVCDMKETRYVRVKKGEARLKEMSEDVAVGDVVHIEGVSDFGNFAAFLIDNVFKDEARIRDGEFSWDWYTGGEREGCCEIEVFILNEHAPFSTGEHVSSDWQSEEGVDASARICVLHPKPPAAVVSVVTGKKEYSPGDMMKTRTRISNPADDTQVVSLKWYLGIPKYDLWIELRRMSVTLPPGHDQIVTVSIPVGDWGAESFCGCHLVSLSDTTVVSMDSSMWTYTPGALSKSKASEELAKELRGTIGGIDTQIG